MSVKHREPPASGVRIIAGRETVIAQHDRMAGQGWEGRSRGEQGLMGNAAWANGDRCQVRGGEQHKAR